MKPVISVVMSTFDDAAWLAESVDSVLVQNVQNIEFIIVNDGSPDPDTGRILAGVCARDSRVRVISKPNEGLTRALIDACAEASGKYIARIDTGDRYLEGRLDAQYRLLEQHPHIAVCSCWTRFVDDAGHVAFEGRRNDSPEAARAALRANRLKQLKGVTHHGAVMFRNDAYKEVGGYRPEFYFAQDVDLWCRMTDHHGIAFLPRVLYEARLSASGISGLYSPQQFHLARLIIKMRRARESGISEDPLLREAARIRPCNVSPLHRRMNRARGEYFLACQLKDQSPARAWEHFKLAVRANPLHLRAVLRLLELSISRRGGGNG